jgi:hypothetical protein
MLLLVSLFYCRLGVDTSGFQRRKGTERNVNMPPNTK